MQNYVNLHSHSVGSMLDGLAQPQAYIDRAKELGQVGIALTDHGNTHMWMDFYGRAKEAGVKPILGEEFYQARKTRFDRDEEERAGRANDELDQRGPYHLTVLAADLTGYHNLIKLSSRAFLEGYYVKPRIDVDLLAQHTQGLIVLSGCLNGAVQQQLLRNDTEAALRVAAQMQDVVGKDNYYIEIMDHGLDEQKYVERDLLHIAKVLGAKLVPTCDCHYAHRDDADAHDTLLCVSTNSLKTQEDRFRFHGPDFYLKSYDEMAKVFPTEWLANTVEIAEKINVDLKFGELYFPEFPIPNGYTIDSFLEKLIWEGVQRRYGHPTPVAVQERIDHELRVVKKMGFQSYFLVVWDLVKWAKDNRIRVGWGRGSAAGSIISYVLGITNLDPLQFGLLFERFLVEAKSRYDPVFPLLNQRQYTSTLGSNGRTNS